MRKVFIILLLLMFSVSAFTQEFVISGEVKTGVLWEKVEDKQGTPDSLKEKVRLHSKDDAGPGDGRFRINMEYTSSKEYLGFSARLNWENFNNAPTDGPNWSYAFGWGNFFNDLLTVSIGKLGASPWGTGGPEMWKELEMIRDGGMRIEFKPKFSFGEFNVGFVLNWIDDIAEAGKTENATLLDLLQESVVGASFKHEYFMARGAFRFDSELDDATGRSGMDPFFEGYKLVYRLEEYALDKLVLPGLSVWALGYFQGLGSEKPEIMFMTTNWLFVQYAPPNFTAQIRFGLDATNDKLILFAKPRFSYNFFDGLLVPGVEFGIAKDFGDNPAWPDSPFTYMEVEPKLQVNFAEGAYVAFSYYYKIEYAFATYPPGQTTQWMNLRFGIMF